MLSGVSPSNLPLPQPNKLLNKILKKTDLHTLTYWNVISDVAETRSPGYIKKQKFAHDPAKLEMISRVKWLNNGVLTGICCGLGLEYVLKIEELRSRGIGVTQKNLPKMKPSRTARELSNLQIPLIMKAFKKAQRKDPNIKELRDLKGPAMATKLMNMMMKEVETFTGLKSKIVGRAHKNFPKLLNQLEKIDFAASPNKHYLVIVENPNNSITNNHVIYFNPHLEVTADGGDGRLIKAPRNTDFNLFYLII